MEKIEFASSIMGLSFDLEELPFLIGGRKCLLLFQGGTKKLLEAVHIDSAADLHTMEVPDGEGCKQIRVFEDIVKLMLENEFSRSDVIVAVGGGSLTDLAGFTASLYKRGMSLILIPTTLLGMVDAAIGGKNGIDFGGKKNMIGTFKHPDTVFIHTPFLRSLPELQYRSGLGEVIKYGVSLDPPLLEYMNYRKDGIKARESNATMHVIERCVHAKVGIVKRDEHETIGIREVLNFGHTVG
ncbi:MAG: 3-dehydroquinate synthase family protein, partial [Thermoplasmataceae archaeon]